MTAFKNHAKIESHYQNPSSIIEFLEEFNIYGYYTENLLHATRQKNKRMREVRNREINKQETLYE